MARTGEKIVDRCKDFNYIRKGRTVCLSGVGVAGLALCLEFIEVLLKLTSRESLSIFHTSSCMVSTRRKSKAAATATHHDHDGASTYSIDEPSHPPYFNVPIPIDIDIDELSNLIPEVSFENPTPDTIVSVYRLLLAQVAESNATQRDLDEARAEAERKDVELDQAYQDAENKTNGLESSLEDVQNQLIVSRQQKEQLGMSGITVHILKVHFSVAVQKTTLEAQVANLSTTHSSSSTELDQLKHRVEDSEREKRDLIGVVNRLKEDATQRDGALFVLFLDFVIDGS